MPETIVIEQADTLLTDVVELPDTQQYRSWVEMYMNEAWIIAHGMYQNTQYKKCHFGNRVTWVRADQVGWRN